MNMVHPRYLFYYIGDTLSESQGKSDYSDKEIILFIRIKRLGYTDIARHCTCLVI